MASGVNGPATLAIAEMGDFSERTVSAGGVVMKTGVSAPDPVNLPVDIRGFGCHSEEIPFPSFLR